MSKSFYFLCFLFGISTLSNAQEAKLRKSLDLYLSQSEAFYHEVKAAAPSSRIQKPLKKFSEKDLHNAIDSFNRRWTTRSLLLCYFYDDTKKELNSFLLNSKKIIGSATRKTSRDSLLQEEIEFRDFYGVFRSSSLDRGSSSGTQFRPKRKDTDSLLAKKVSAQLLTAQMADSILNYEQLLVSPTLNLYSFPFALLKPFRSEAFLGASIPICILPGLYEFCSGSSEGGEEFSKVIRKATIVGNPRFNPELHPRDYYGRHPLIDEFFLQDLPYTEAQTTAVRTLLVDKSGTVKVDLLSQMNATKTKFLESADNSDLIYLATHGFSSTQKPWDSSFVAFAMEKERPGENFLSAREIVSKIVSARMVVLSACQTGTGQTWEAGVVSLASAFYYSGAETVISTLWNVDDFFTSMYMREFMKAIIEEGERHPSYYLHRIQKNARSLPRHWAPFICFGL
jgi:CHAT domain-containing protein